MTSIVDQRRDFFGGGIDAERSAIASALAAGINFADMLDAAQNSYRVIAKSNVAVSHTGNTNDTTLATVTVPAGAMGANGRLRITSLWSTTNNANNKTGRVKFGGTTYTSSVIANNASYRTQTEVSNRNATNSQVGYPGGSGLGGSTAVVVTTAVDTTAEVTVLLTGQLASGADTITLESYVVELFPSA